MRLQARYARERGASGRGGCLRGWQAGSEQIPDKYRYYRRGYYMQLRARIYSRDLLYLSPLPAHRAREGCSRGINRLQGKRAMRLAAFTSA